MKDRINSLLEITGLSTNAVLVLESDLAYTLMYPNHMQIQDWTYRDVKDEDLLSRIECMIEEHLENVKNDLKMLKRFRSQFI